MKPKLIKQCQICKKKVDGKTKVMDRKIGEITVCGSCLNDFAIMDYNQLMIKLETNGQR